MSKKKKRSGGYPYGAFVQGIAIAAACVGVVFAFSLILRNMQPLEEIPASSHSAESSSLPVVSQTSTPSVSSRTESEKTGEVSAVSSDGGDVPSSQPVSSSESSSLPESSSEISSTVPVQKPPAGEKEMYPELFLEKPEYVPHREGDKVVYLTFDDGPSDLTFPLLDVLDRYGVKATFFDVGIRGETAEKAMRETVNRGHVLAVHTYSHEFRSVYASKEAYLEDFKREWEYIYSVTGVKPTIFRFPGGSVNSYNKATARSIIGEMNRRGYTYYDWNVDSGDATGNGIPCQTIYNNVISGVQGKEKAVVLLHNTNRKQTTLDAMPRIIEKLQDMGYRFDVLTNRVAPVQFRIPE